LRKYHEKTRAKNTRERTSRVRSAHERARILTSLFLSSSCENRVQTTGTGQSPFSPPRFSESRLTFFMSDLCKLY